MPITVRFRFRNPAVPPTLYAYCILNVFTPAVRPVMTPAHDPVACPPVPAPCKSICKTIPAVWFVAALIVDAPDTATEARSPSVDVPEIIWADMKISAEVFVCTETEGPGVARSANVPDVVV